MRRSSLLIRQLLSSLTIQFQGKRRVFWKHR